MTMRPERPTEKINIALIQKNVPIPGLNRIQIVAWLNWIFEYFLKE